MREIRGLAEVIRQNAKQLRDNVSQAAANFKHEANQTNQNVKLVNTAVGEMKAANQEVTALLADLGTNFPEDPLLADKNGVTPNKGKP